MYQNMFGIEELNYMNSLPYINIFEGKGKKKIEPEEDEEEPNTTEPEEYDDEEDIEPIEETC